MANKLKIPVSIGRVGVGKGGTLRVIAHRYTFLSTYSIHLTQYCAFSKKEWFPCVHQDEVKVGLPWSVGAPRLIREKQQKPKHHS